MGKPADQSVGFVYPAGGSDSDIGVYKQPQPNTDTQPESVVAMSGNAMGKLNISVGGVSKGNYAGVNPVGQKEMRGYGAATKGRKISGKQG